MVTPIKSLLKDPEAPQIISRHVVQSEGKKPLVSFLKRAVRSAKETKVISTDVISASVYSGIAELVRQGSIVIAKEGHEAAKKAGCAIPELEVNELVGKEILGLIERQQLFSAACAVTSFDLPSAQVEAMKPAVAERLRMAKAAHRAEVSSPILNGKNQKLSVFSFLPEQRGQLAYIMEVFGIKARGFGYSLH